MLTRALLCARQPRSVSCQGWLVRMHVLTPPKHISYWELLSSQNRCKTISEFLLLRCGRMVIAYRNQCDASRVLKDLRMTRTAVGLIIRTLTKVFPCLSWIQKKWSRCGFTHIWMRSYITWFRTSIQGISHSPSFIRVHFIFSIMISLSPSGKLALDNLVVCCFNVSIIPAYH